MPSENNGLVSSASQTISADADSPSEKSTPDRLHRSDSELNCALESHKLDADTFARSSDAESGRHSLRAVTSYAGQIGDNEGLPNEEVDQSDEKDPNLVEWDGPDDLANPYNW
jgi:hypothetical protein